MRFLMWYTLYLLTLCSIDLEVTYTDGLHIKLNGWCTPLMKWIEKKRAN